jgi:hypothetical protein
MESKQLILLTQKKENNMANDYDDSDLQENKKIAEENKKTIKEIMKKGKMAPEPEDPEQNKPKIKLRCGGSKGYKKGGLVTKGKPKIAKKGGDK